MNFQNRVCQKLYEEHEAVTSLLDGLARTIGRFRDNIPDAKDPILTKLMNDLAAELPGEVERHFSFEEAELFPYLSAAGNQAIGAHLTYEHTIIRPIATALVELIEDIRGNGLNAVRWAEFRRLGQELIDFLEPHAQKENMALLPMLEDSMDTETEGRLYQEYVVN
jgi:hemerythrin-like domain-containing protein